MGKILVIVESPHKAKTIQKYLGKDYQVVASMGHIRDLAVGNASNHLGVDIENDFAPIYEIAPTKTFLINKLKGYVKDASDVYLATDPDREGEAISWHLAEELGLDASTTKRLEFHEITYPAIKKALEAPRNIDMNLVYSQETRRILDRILGFKLSNLLKSKIGSKSAGRVQSAVLKIIVDRQNEIDSFKSETFYKVEGTLLVDKTKVNVSLKDIDNKEVTFNTIDDALKAIKEIKESTIELLSYDKEAKTRSSKPTYTTSTMQQDAATLLHFDSKKTMRIAQELYEGLDLGNGEVGLITYMRTDSVRLAPEFINKAKAYIEATYGKEYVGKAKLFNKNSDLVQDAHEGIRPTDVNITPDMVAKAASKDQAKLYELIFNRTIASMMVDQTYDKETAIFEAGNYNLVAEGEIETFKGYKALLKDKDQVKSLDINPIGSSKISLSDIKEVESQTKGPYPYNEASLIHTMEKEGIGRPSTYATTLDTIRKRLYVEVKNNYYIPTSQGKLTVDKLEENFASLINVEYTANMETKLDEIAEGKFSRSKFLEEFYDSFSKDLEVAKNNMKKEVVEQEEDIDLGVCPNCGKPLVKRVGRYGSFVACSGYPTCKYILQDNKEGKICPKCNKGTLILKKSKFGRFYACSCYPECDYIESNKTKR